MGQSLALPRERTALCDMSRSRFFSLLLIAAGAAGGGLLTLALVRGGGGRSAGELAFGQPSVASAVDAKPPLETDAREPLSALGEAISNPDRDARGEALRQLARRLAGEDLARGLEIGGRIPDANDQLEFMRALFAAWAAQDPQGALEYAKTRFSPGLLQSEVLAAALEKWGAQKPQAAWQWVEANVTGPFKEQALAALMQGWTRADPAGAAGWFAASGSTSQSALSALVSTWADLNPRAAAAWIETLAIEENKTVARVVLATEWAQQNSAEAAAYFAPMLTGTKGQDLAAALVNSWAAKDPGAAAAWIEQLQPGPARDQAAGALATIWAATDIQAAIKWSEKLPPALQPGVIDHLGTTWGAIEPQKALAWLATLPLGETRTQATRGALDSWAATDVPGMQHWLATQPASATADLARVSLGEVLASRDPAAALETARGIAHPVQRAETMSRFFRHWRQSDDAAAQAWLQSAWPRLSPDLQQHLDREQRRTVVPR
jgi:hypothetical protein